MTFYRFLSSFILRKIKEHPSYIKIISNVGWLFADRILRMTIGLFVGVWVARFLGPEQFGLMNYAISFVTLFSTLSSVGINNVVIRDLVNNPNDASVTLGTAFVIQIFGGLLALTFAITAISIIRHDHLTKIIVAILSSAVIFKASEVVKYWFESQVASKHTVLVEQVGFLVAAFIKVILILNQAPLISFVWTMFGEAILVATGLLAMYTHRGGMLKSWRPRIHRMKTLLKDSWPLFLSGISIVVYMRIDQIMLGQIIGNEAVGVYSAAVRISEMAYFIPVIIVSSVSPSLIAANNQGQKAYQRQLLRLYRIILFASLGISLLTTFFSTDIIQLLYGVKYKLAGNVLAIHIWASVFVALGVASSQPLLIANLQRLSLYRTLIGCILNIVLNLLLIPSFDINGAAIATSLSYFIATFSLILFANGRPIVSFMFRSIFLFPARKT